MELMLLESLLGSAEVQHCLEVACTALLCLDNVGISVATQPCACRDTPLLLYLL